MADDPLERTTSFAKSIKGLVQTENALDRARGLKEQYDQTQQQHQQSRQTEQAKDGSEQQGSQKIRQDKPAPELKPGGSMRPAARQQDARAKFARELDLSDARLDKVRKAQEDFKKAHQHNHDHDRDRER